MLIYVDENFFKKKRRLQHTKMGKNHTSTTNWWYTYPSEKYESQLG